MKVETIWEIVHKYIIRQSVDMFYGYGDDS